VELRVGCALWAHEPWQGKYLPARLSRRAELAAYASWCNAVESTATFFRSPAPSKIAGWAEQVPAGFRFAFKLPHAITHEHRLRESGAEARAFLATLAPLGDRAEPVSIQLPNTFGPPQVDDLARLLGSLPTSHRYAVEIRNPLFFAGDSTERTLERVLTDHGVEWASFDTATLFAAPPASEAEREAWGKKPRVPARTTALTDRPVVRYVGCDDVARTEAGWQPWLDIVVGWLEEGRVPTVFVHTPDNDDALLLARRFHDQVRARLPQLDPLPEPERPTPT